MGQFTLCNDFPGDYTLISNYFLDVCMPQANGEFVKVYLYLLRNATGVSASLELSSIADIFNCTENILDFSNEEGTGTIPPVPP